LREHEKAFLPVVAAQSLDDVLGADAVDVAPH
jgi:hypothetical protein